ncbi:MAG TPA: Rap1a/Tai family immunity protein [Alphaproteobacteria bacterium]|nr:Rap1a/Tai family immunity protein [Alphaproteobacteria bacterium]
MAARNFGFWLVTAWALLPLSAASAKDTLLSGAELMARCQGTPEVLKSDQLYCKGYLEGIEDLATYSRGQGGSAPFCVPPEGVTDEELRESYMKWGKEHVGELTLPALNAAIAAMRTAYPCK